MSDDSDRKMVKVGNRMIPVARSRDPDFASSPAPRGMSPPVEDGPKGTAIVARGRTVIASDQTKRFQTGFDPHTGAPVYMFGERSFGPGQSIELPVAEIARLRALGFLVDPSKLASDEQAARLPSGPPRHATSADVKR